MEELIFDKKGEFAINFSWRDEKPSWVDFTAVTVCSDYMDEENPKFITFDTGSGISSNCTNFNEAVKEDLFFEGFIKWDGCMEIHNLSYHFCHKSNILQRCVDLIYDSAKIIMKTNADFN